MLWLFVSRSLFFLLTLYISISDTRYIIFYVNSGCGSGKYLSCNPSVFSLGVDRCRALTELAREKDNEVGTQYLVPILAVDADIYYCRY